MTTPSYATSRITEADAASGFRCGKHPLDDYFARHAVRNDQSGVGRAYVLRRGDDDDVSLPAVFGFYTLSMASVSSEQATAALQTKFPKYPMPVAIIGRLAGDERARGGGRRLGERLLLDAMRRIIAAAELLGCIGVIVDAKDADGEVFYAKYDFVTVTSEWPRRMFLAIDTARDALS